MPSSLGTYLESFPNLILAFSLKLHQEKNWVFTQTQKNERWVFKESTHFFLENPFKKIFFKNLDEIFLESKQPQKEKERKNSLTTNALLVSKNGRNLYLKGKRMVEN